MSQDQRDRVMGRLRAATVDLLVATDVAARGLDVEHLTHVVNYDVPSAPESYVHRIGRVGRGGREGVAITLAEPREHRMLKTIERVTKRRIPVEKVPTTADLRARRLELTRAALHELLLEDDLDPFRVVVETLSDDFDMMQVALAAVKLAHEATGGGTDTEDIPEVATPPVREERGRGAAGGRDARGTASGRGAAGGRPPRARGQGGPTTRIYIAAGRSTGIRPQDIVGAIAGETALSGHDVGAIEITDRFSLVEVPESSADEVLSALQNTRIKGKKVQVRLDRDVRR
jgi:ATP-dependent RNA helicase DeaD